MLPISGLSVANHPAKVDEPPFTFTMSALTSFEFLRTGMPILCGFYDMFITPLPWRCFGTYLPSRLAFKTVFFVFVPKVEFGLVPLLG